MNYLIEIVRGSKAGTPLKLELLTSSTSDLETQLIKVAADAAAATPASGAYDAVLKAAYKAATGTAFDVKYPLPTTSISVNFKAPEGSIYIPGLPLWLSVPGKNYLLALDPGGSDEADLISKYDYYMQIRPATVAGECPIFIPTAALMVNSGRDRLGVVKDRLAGVTLLLSHSRTVVLSIRGSRRGQQETDRSPGPLVNHELNMWTYDRQPELTKDGEYAILYVRFIGDPPHVRGATLLTNDVDSVGGELEPCGDCDPLPDPPAVHSLASFADLSAFGVTWEREMRRRLCLIHRIPGDIRPHLFFYNLDKRSNPRTDLGRSMLWIGGLLPSIYMERASFFDSTGEGRLPTSRAEMVAIEAHVAPAARFVLDMIKTYLGTPSGDIDFDAVDSAFTRFARGELGIFASHGVPDGVNMFAFAELARLCVILRPKGSNWTRLFEIFARSCEIFVCSYHDDTSAMRLVCSYKPENNLLGRRGPDGAQQARLRKKWRSADTESRFSALVHAALHDETKRIDKKPMRLVEYEPGMTS